MEEIDKRRRDYSGGKREKGMIKEIDRREKQRKRRRIG